MHWGLYKKKNKEFWVNSSYVMLESEGLNFAVHKVWQVLKSLSAF